MILPTSGPDSPYRLYLVPSVWYGVGHRYPLWVTGSVYWEGEDLVSRGTDPLVSEGDTGLTFLSSVVEQDRGNTLSSTVPPGLFCTLHGFPCDP